MADSSTEQQHLGTVRTAAEELVATLQQVDNVLCTGLPTREPDVREFRWQCDVAGEIAKQQRVVDEAFDGCLQQLSATGVVGRANQALSRPLWDLGESLLERGRLQWRARTKPRGYAGDDVMLKQIFDFQRCDDELGKLMDAYFLRQDAPVAVRERILLASEGLAAQAAQQSGPLHWVSVGSGPAIELQLALESIDDPQRVRITLLDLDQQALDAAGARLRKILPADQVNCVRENLFRLPQRPQKAAALGEADFLVCLGLLDYLEDEHARAMLAMFYDRLGCEGQLLVGNFAPQTRARAYMEWIGNWYLIYRTEDAFLQLAQAAGIPAAQTTLASVAWGADLLLRARRP